MRFLIIQNPNTGNRNPERIRGQIEQFAQNFEHELEVWQWAQAGRIDELMQAARQRNFDGIIAAGGDGTAHHVGKRLIGTETMFGILPIGSGNAIANHLGIKGGVQHALNMLQAYQTQWVDTGAVNEDAFLGLFGIGLDAKIAHRFANAKQRGFATYFSLLWDEYFTFQPEPLHLSVNGSELDVQSTVFGVMNSAEFGNGAKMAPGASMQDGQLDLFYADAPPAWQAPKTIYVVFNGKIRSQPWYKSFRADGLTVRRKQAGPAQLDGEPVILPQMLHLRVRPRSLKLMLPAENGTQL